MASCNLITSTTYINGVRCVASGIAFMSIKLEHDTQKLIEHDQSDGEWLMENPDHIGGVFQRMNYAWSNMHIMHSNIDMNCAWSNLPRIHSYTYRTYRTISNIRRTKSQNLNVSRLGLRMSLRNILKPSVKWRMKMQLEQRRQAMLQLQWSDQQFNCLLKCVLY